MVTLHCNSELSRFRFASLIMLPKNGMASTEHKLSSIYYTPSPPCPPVKLLVLDGIFTCIQIVPNLEVR